MSSSIALLSFSLKDVCQYLLLHALHAVASDQLEWSQDDVTAILPVATAIPIKRMDTGCPVSYVSAIAFQWSRALGQNPLLIATSLVEQVNRSLTKMVKDYRAEHRSADGAIALQREMIVTVSSPGWIVFEVSAIGMATWLQTLISMRWTQVFKQIDEMALMANTNNTIQANHQNLQQENSQWNDTLMHSQYAHARCCAWLRIAQDAHLRLEQSISSLILNHPHQLQIVLQASSALILSLVDVVDDVRHVMSQIESIESKEGQVAGDRMMLVRQAAKKWCEQLSNQALAFQSKYSLGEMVHGDEDFDVDFRLALIRLSQLLLKGVLEDVLHEKAPTVL